MSVWDRANAARREESAFARAGVRRLQTGHDPSFYFERAAACRAERYEYEATGDALKPLVDARNAELFPHIRSFRA